MLKLNILSEEQKKEVNLKNIYRSIYKITSVIVIIVSFFAVLFLCSIYMLDNKLVGLNASSVIKNSSAKNLTNDIKKINNQIKFIETIQKNNIQWTKVLNEISKFLNNDIHISSISLSLNGKENLIIKGHSKTRESLLNFKNNLEDKENFTDIDFPLKNLLEKNDIKFEIKAKITSYEFE